MRKETSADRESFVRGGLNFDKVFFLVNEVIEDPNVSINWPSSARQRNVIFKWRFVDGPMKAQN